MSNNTPLIVELDSTYRCRNENPLPGKFTVDVIPKNDEIIKDPVSSQAPINYWRGANFKDKFCNRWYYCRIIDCKTCRTSFT